jgi:hypothetical protein
MDMQPLPKCLQDCLEFSLEYNPHKGDYETAKQYIEESERTEGFPRQSNWVSPEQRQKAVDTDTMWYIQCYPTTPIGFWCYAAADLDVLMDHLNEWDKSKGLI